MGNPRLKGQEVFVTLLVNNVISQAFKAVVDLTVTDNVELLEEDLLGEVASRLDDIYKTTSFSTTLQVEDGSVDDLRELIVNRSKRRAGSAARIDLSYAQALPNGQTRQIQLQNLFFGPLEKSISERAGFVTQSLEGSCSETADQTL